MKIPLDRGSVQSFIPILLDVLQCLFPVGVEYLPISYKVVKIVMGKPAHLLVALCRSHVPIPVSRVELLRGRTFFFLQLRHVNNLGLHRAFAR